MPKAAQRKEKSPIGFCQLSLVEHSLCPLDPNSSLVDNLVHQVEYRYSNAKRQRQTARAKVFCPLGLSGSDELYLWGLLAISLNREHPDERLVATPHWCLRQLGLVDAGSRRGGRQYRQFFDVIRRLSAVQYLSDAFYDPVRGEHRSVSFGLLSYSLPQDTRSSRAWHLVWDPIFFEMIRVTAGHMRFDLETYRQLDVASRRLFLFASKILYRRDSLPKMNLRRLAVDVLGASESLSTRDMKVKVNRCLQRLHEHGVLSDATIERVRPGEYILNARRGEYFQRAAKELAQSTVLESPLVEILIDLGFQPIAARRLVRRYRRHDIEQWCDITQAALERHGKRFFKKSPMAFLVDSLKESAAGRRTPPDWWQELRRSESKQDDLSSASIAMFTKLTDEIFDSTAPSQKISELKKLDRAADVLRGIPNRGMLNPK